MRPLQMKKLYTLALLCLTSLASAIAQPPHYTQNRAPLIEKPLLELPLGSIQPQGWLLEQLERMATGMTGHLDELYPEVVGPRNGWLGGDGDGWERGPYWIDGLLPLAYILNDQTLKDKVQPWIDWTLENQAESGYLGPVPFDQEPEAEAGLQRGNRTDWWPKMVMLKILQQYYSATGDERVISALTNYFRYQLQELPTTPLDHLTLWANRRGGDNLMVVYWLYNITGDQFLLDLGDIIAEQTFPWSEIFRNAENHNDPVSPWHYQQLKRYPFDTTEINNLTVSKIGGMHCVNLAQGLKEPIIRYQFNHDKEELAAVKKALRDIKYFHGQPQGMYGGDEPLHGKNPVQGVEFCSIAEEMFSLETMISITGEMAFADQLERIVYNALPTQANDDFTKRQYMQAANQVELTDQLATSYETQPHRGTDFVYGLLSGYPCCTCNMHQSWPKFVQNLFYATKDNGVAAISYAPSEVRLTVGNQTQLALTEETGFPFREEINFTMQLSQSDQFPFVLRAPTWCENPEVIINGELQEIEIEEQKISLDRTWHDGDKITLRLPMKFTTSIWYDFSIAVERGPLVYALKIRGEEKSKARNDKYGAFTEVFPVDPWNYGLIRSELDNLEKSITIHKKDWAGDYPWNLENAPIELTLSAVQIPEWKTVNSAPVLPGSWGVRRPDKELEVSKITLIPYGCTTLRITEFPVYEIEP